MKRAPVDFCDDPAAIAGTSTGSARVSEHYGRVRWSIWADRKPLYLGGVKRARRRSSQQVAAASVSLNEFTWIAKVSSLFKHCSLRVSLSIDARAFPSSAAPLQVDLEHRILRDHTLPAVRHQALLEGRHTPLHPLRFLLLLP